jgi:hypothetical protein
VRRRNYHLGPASPSLNTRFQTSSHDQDSRVGKYKARNCMREDKQIERVDFDETYRSALAWTIVRMMKVMAATLNLKITQIDFSDASVETYL